MEGLLQPVHLFFILLIVLILFGPGKLPELGKGLGKGIKEFKDALRGGMDGFSRQEGREEARGRKEVLSLRLSPPPRKVCPIRQRLSSHSEFIREAATLTQGRGPHFALVRFRLNASNVHLGSSREGIYVRP